MSLSLTAKVKIGLLVLALVLGIAVPYLFGSYMVSILTLGLILGLFAMSIDLIGGYGGMVSLGQAGILAVGAYGVGYIASNQLGGHLEQILVGLLAALVASVIFALMAMRTTGTYFLMVTLAFGMIVWGLSIRLSGVTGAENGLRGLYRPAAIAAYWKYYYVTLAVVVLCSGLMFIIVHSPFGLALRGLKNSETRLQMLGYNIPLLKFLAMTMAGCFTGIAGVLYGYYNQFISPTTAEFATSGQGVLMAILGGIGTLVGPLIGAFVIVLIENLLSVYVVRWPTVMGLIFIAVILFARQGLVGTISAGWNSWLWRRGKTEEAAARAAARGAVLGTDPAVDAVATTPGAVQSTPDRTAKSKGA